MQYLSRLLYSNQIYSRLAILMTICYILFIPSFPMFSDVVLLLLIVEIVIIINFRDYNEIVCALKVNKCNKEIQFEEAGDKVYV